MGKGAYRWRVIFQHKFAELSSDLPLCLRCSKKKVWERERERKRENFFEKLHFLIVSWKAAQGSNEWVSVGGISGSKLLLSVSDNLFKWKHFSAMATQRMQIIGKYGLKNKREIWRVQLILTRFRKAARELLTLDPKDPRRLFEGAALMRKMSRYGLLTQEENKLDYILGLTINKLMERRL